MPKFYNNFTKKPFKMTAGSKMLKSADDFQPSTIQDQIAQGFPTSPIMGPSNILGGLNKLFNIGTDGVFTNTDMPPAKEEKADGDVVIPTQDKIRSEANDTIRDARLKFRATNRLRRNDKSDTAAYVSRADARKIKKKEINAAKVKRDKELLESIKNKK
tara:strand:+ start:105 stop:581 length:477 start_codon:yes stop_codon:yes gene_type:complete